jgi:flagellar M-ring protein FliF
MPTMADNALALNSSAANPAASASFVERVRSFSPGQIMAVLGGIAALIAVLAVSLMWTKEPDWRVLFSGLGDKDAGAVVAGLDKLQVPYKLSEGGGAILVPGDRVHDARLKLASQGLPKGGTVGFELMDTPRFGMTQFQERLQYQRGLEGELSRSIGALGAVQSARVHLALPAQNTFLRDNQRPSASVLLNLHPGRSLDRSQIAGIVHLVASSVPELSPKQVSVVDSSGALLSGEDASADKTGLDPGQIQYVSQLESAYIKRITDILEPIVGRGNVRAQVKADVDFNHTEATVEEFKPNNGDQPAAIRSTSTQEASNGAGAAAAGVPGALSNQPPGESRAPINGANPAPQAAGQSAGGQSNRSAVTNFEVDKTVRYTRNATGSVRRISAAVVVNQKANTDKGGKTSFTAIPEKEMEQINALVREAIGFSKDRGDSINVVNAPFKMEEAAKPVELPFWKQPEAGSMIKNIGMPVALLLIALAIIFGVIRPALRRAQVAREEAQAAATQSEGRINAVLDDAEALPAPERAGVPLLPNQAPNENVNDLRTFAKDNPAAVALIVRDWMAGGKAETQ